MEAVPGEVDQVDLGKIKSPILGLFILRNYFQIDRISPATINETRYEPELIATSFQDFFSQTIALASVAAIKPIHSAIAIAIPLIHVVALAYIRMRASIKFVIRVSIN